MTSLESLGYRIVPQRSGVYTIFEIENGFASTTLGEIPNLNESNKEIAIKLTQAPPEVIEAEFQRLENEAKTEQTKKAKNNITKNVEEQTKKQIGETKASAADQMLGLFLSKEPLLFYDQHSIPYVRIKQGKYTITISTRSRKFRTWLSGFVYTIENKVPSEETIRNVINVLCAKTMVEGKQYTLYNRVAPTQDGAFWIDMTDNTWRAIKVDDQGWQIIENTPIPLFKRYSHQKPLAKPTHGGDPLRLLSYFNIAPEDEETRLTLLVLLTTYFIPSIPHPILVLHGSHGTCKTTMCKIIRSIFDPSSTEVITIAHQERELIQQLDHHWNVFFDNVTRLPVWVSDALCRAVTGGGFSKRELYSDDDDVTYNFTRCIEINGINIAPNRSDLLDRCLLVHLEPVDQKNRTEESSLLQSLEKEKPSILGAFLDLLVKAMQYYPEVKPEKLFRMADFTHWGCAIAKALGKTEEDFMTAYENKVVLQNEEAAEGNLVATVLLDYLQDAVDGKKLNSPDTLLTEPIWIGTPTELHKDLLAHAKILKIRTYQSGYPKAPQHLIQKINELIPTLKVKGWLIETGKKVGGVRKVTIFIDHTVLSSSDFKVEDNGVDKDDKIPASKEVTEEERIADLNILFGNLAAEKPADENTEKESQDKAKEDAK